MLGQKQGRPLLLGACILVDDIQGAAREMGFGQEDVLV